MIEFFAGALFGTVSTLFFGLYVGKKTIEKAEADFTMGQRFGRAPAPNSSGGTLKRANLKIVGPVLTDSRGDFLRELARKVRQKDSSTAACYAYHFLINEAALEDHRANSFINENEPVRIR